MVVCGKSLLILKRAENQLCVHISDPEAYPELSAIKQANSLLLLFLGTLAHLLSHQRNGALIQVCLHNMYFFYFFTDISQLVTAKANSEFTRHGEQGRLREGLFSC